MRHGRTFVVHAGALGDGVLLWPMLRSMVVCGERVTLVAHDSKARLAARHVGVEYESIESARWRAMWDSSPCVSQRQSATTCDTGPSSVARVLSFVADGANGVWARNAQEAFPDAAIEFVERKLNRRLAIELATREGGGGLAVEVRRGRGPYVLHVGAGSEEKRWPMERWAELKEVLSTQAPVRVIAGEVEMERFSPTDRRAFERLGGVFLSDLEALADGILNARVFVGCDSGPAHLAAQLGAATAAIFLVTGPEEWAPIGPAVRVVGGVKRTVAVRELAETIRQMSECGTVAE